MPSEPMAIQIAVEGMDALRAKEAARMFSADQRKKAAAAGQAQKDGSFPIKNAQDLRNAIQAFGRSKNKAATKAHIIRRAKALGLTRLLPKGWTSDSASGDMITCPEDECARLFLDERTLSTHAEAVHPEMD